ncbi:hypothetical protein SDC9_104188 [bioreactor metagenome]|uniref:Uncharacterized protein n=1 Tax=bioreactor metagenome TaxID=1076179 RepID=A0A645AX45_9ZZZZ
MCSENVASLYFISGLVKGEAGLHQLADAFHGQEGRMALVHVPDHRVETQHTQGLNAAHAQEDLLRNAHFKIAAVQTGGQLAVGGGVVINIGIQQVEADTAHFHFPDAGKNFATRKIYRDLDGIVLFIQQSNDGELIEIGDVGTGFLPTILGEVLNKVALAVNEADCGQRQVQIGGLFEVVARKNAQTACIERDRFMQTELEREIGYLFVCKFGIGGFVPGGFVGEVVLEL